MRKTRSKCPYRVEIVYHTGNEDTLCFRSKDDAGDFIDEKMAYNPDWKMRLVKNRKSSSRARTAPRKRSACKHGRTARGTCRKTRRR